MDQELDAWRNRVQLGRYTPDSQDWAQIEARAKEVGKVVIYGCPSRILKVAQTFVENYGVEVEAYDCMLPEGLIYNFMLEPLAESIPQEHKTPRFVHSLEGRIVFYNAEAYPEGPPIDNQWDLTRPEWKGKVLFKNPGGDLAFHTDLCNNVTHSYDLKAAYERKYGKLVLSAGIPNAEYEYIYRLLKNDLVLMKSGGNVAEGVGSAGEENPPISFTGYAKIRYNETKGTVLAVASGIDPFETQTALRYLAICRSAPHPNTAKLFISLDDGKRRSHIRKNLEPPYDKNESAWLLQGRVPWFMPGDYAPINGYPIPKGTIPLEELSNWTHDVGFAWDRVIQIQEFWMSHRD